MAKRRTASACTISAVDEGVPLHIRVTAESGSTVDGQFIVRFAPPPGRTDVAAWLFG